VSNPPYIPLQEKNSMPQNVVQSEPHLALFVPDEDSLIFYRAIAEFGKNRLYPQGNIYFEIHENIAERVMKLLNDMNYLTVLKKDMQGKDRMIKAGFE
jgi:release factor glutamine methyltransferase